MIAELSVTITNPNEYHTTAFDGDDFPTKVIPLGWNSVFQANQEYWFEPAQGSSNSRIRRIRVCALLYNKTLSCEKTKYNEFKNKDKGVPPYEYIKTKYIMLTFYDEDNKMLEYVRAWCTVSDSTSITITFPSKERNLVDYCKLFPFTDSIQMETYKNNVKSVYLCNTTIRSSNEPNKCVIVDYVDLHREDIKKFTFPALLGIAIGFAFVATAVVCLLSEEKTRKYVFKTAAEKRQT